MNRLKLMFPLKRINGKPLIVLSVKRKKVIKGIRIVLTIFSLLSAFIVINDVFITFTVGLGVFLVSSTLEKSLFYYFSFYIHPLADFELDQSHWTGVGFGYLSPPTRSDIRIPLVSWIFDNSSYAENMYKLLLAWLKDGREDKNHNIIMRVVLHRNNQYTFYCYPSDNSSAQKQIYADIEKEMEQSKDTRDDLHYKMIIKLTLGKLFDMPPTSMLPEFMSNYNNGDRFVFRIIIKDNSGNIINSDIIDDLILYDLKVVNESDITRRDSEFDLIRFFKHKNK